MLFTVSKVQRERRRDKQKTVIIQTKNRSYVLVLDIVLQILLALFRWNKIK